MNIQFVSVERKSLHSVEVTYKLGGSTSFTVEWNNIHPSTGEVEMYDLQLDVKCADESLKERIEDAIKAGESDDNVDIDIYLFVRDEFDQHDAENLGIDNLTVTDWSIESHGQTATVNDKFGNTYEVSLQLPRTPDSQQKIDAEDVVFDDKFQSAVYEAAKYHLYNLFEDDDIALASFSLGKIVDNITTTSVDEIKSMLDCSDIARIKRLIASSEMITAHAGDEVYFLWLGRYSDYYNVRYFDEVDFYELDND